jgi:polysaccharide biosynthesis transport protein
MEIKALNISSDNFRDVELVFRNLFKHKWTIAGFVVAMLIVVFSILQVITPIYQSEATLLIESQDAKVVNVDEIYGVGQSREYFNTQVEILKSRETAIKTIIALKLWEVPEFDPTKKGVFASVMEAIGLSPSALGISTALNKKPTDIDLAELVYESFSKNLQVKPVRLSQLVIIGFESADPLLSQRVANTLAKTYINNDRDSKFNMTQEASSWLQSRLEGLRGKLLESEQALQSYREKQGIIDVNGSVQTLAAQQISDVSQRLIEARVKRAELQSAYDQIVRIKDGDYSSVPAVVRSIEVAQARSRESAAASDVTQLKERYGSEHPKMLAAIATLNAAKADTRQQMSLVVSGLTREYEVARATERALEGSLSSARGSLQTVNRSGTELGALERDVASNKQIYETFLNRAKETSSTTDLQTSVGRIVDEASLGEKIKPKKGLILVVSFLLSLIIGVVGALWYEKLDNTVKGQEDAENRLGAPVLTSVPMLEEDNRTDVAHLVISQPESLFAESIRTANTGISLSNIDGDQKVILITSSVAGEGKTSFSCNMALSLAGSRKVLLIDGDMRRPKVAECFDMKSVKVGLSSVLIGQAEVEAALIPIAGTKLTIMPVGVIPSNPLDLIASNRFKDLLAKLKDQFDYILIDSPPIGLVSDALAFSTLVDSAIYVVKCMDTPAPLAAKGIRRIMDQNTKIMGIVLNQLDFRSSHLYYGEYTPYSKYGYTGYGYSAEDDKDKA